jgi:hypothetical protein
MEGIFFPIEIALFDKRRKNKQEEEVANLATLRFPVTGFV